MWLGGLLLVMTPYPHCQQRWLKVARRHCTFQKADRQHCQAPPLRDSDYCLMHSPEHAAEVAEARRLGGLRRRREATVSGAYDIGDLNTVADVRRLIQIAVLDTLSLENSVPRSRTLAYLAMAALKTLEVGEMEGRLATLEAVVLSSKPLLEPVFDIDQNDDSISEVS